MAVKLGVVGYGAGRREGRQPVPAYEGIKTLAVFDAARLSAEIGRSVEVSSAAPAPALHR